MSETQSAVTAAKYRIRPLIKRDQRVVAGMLSKLADEFDESTLRDIISSTRSTAGDGEGAGSAEVQRARVVEVFFALFRRCLVQMTADVEAWLAELIGVTPEQYQELPIDIDVQILNQMKEAPEVERFFTGALQLFSGTGWFQTALSRAKDAFGSVSGSLQSSSKD